MAFTKRALTRDSSVPVGQPAPMHIECRCGNNVDIQDAANACRCGAVYDAAGWVIRTSDASKTEVAPQYL